MRWRAFIFVSLAANVLLAGAWLVSARYYRALTRRSAPTTAAAPGLPQVRTNVVVRHQFFSWQEVESTNYPTYIANLREIGCPEQTIRDIIVADVNALFARKRLTEVVTPAQQWWRSTPDPIAVRAAVAKLRELEQERRTLLASLLGPDWDTTGASATNTAATASTAPVLDGPVLGALPSDVKKAVADISARAGQRVQAYVAAQQAEGQPLDPATLASLRQQTRIELAKVLSPEQLEEFLLRYSQDAENLRAELGQLKYFNATPDEFRAIFRATDQIDQQLAQWADSTDPNGVAQRQALEQQRQNAIKLALGPDRYRLYQMLQDPGYRVAYAQALQAGSPDSAAALYQINQAATQELVRIQANTNLTPQQLDILAKRTQVDQATAAAQALGQDVPPLPPTPPPPPPQMTHVVASGEGLDFLARLYRIQPSDIRAANPNVNFNTLKAGTTVNIPISLVPVGPILPRQ